MELKEIRNRIDVIDSAMAELFEKRMEAVADVAAYKSERGLAIEDLAREQQLIDEKSALIEDEEIRALYISFLRNLMDISKKRQHRLMYGLRVACAGDEGSDGHKAACAVFPESEAVIYRHCSEAYRAAETGECDVAVLPLENSFSGEVGKVYDLIFSGTLFVNDVYAVGNNGSTTRYAVLSRAESKAQPAAGDEALLMMFTVKDEIGGLAKAVNIISAYDYNMRVMRSRPLKGLPWHYYFYAEMVGSCSDESCERIVRALGASCPVVKIAGRFADDRTVLEARDE